MLGERTRLRPVISPLDRLKNLVVVAFGSGCITGILPARQGGMGETGDVLTLQITAAISTAIAIAISADECVVAISMEVTKAARACLSALTLIFTLNSIFFLLELGNGFGSPDDGKEFGKGQTDFSVNITNILENAAPDEWFGDGAARYFDKNEKQKLYVDRIAEIDHGIAKDIESQAALVELGRMLFASMRIALSGLGIAVSQYAAAVMADAVAGVSFGYDDELDRFLSFVGLAAWIFLLCVAGVISYIGYEAEYVLSKHIKNRREEYRQIINDVNAYILSDASIRAFPEMACR